MTGLNLNYEKKNRLKLDGNIRWNHSDGDIWTRKSTENFISSTLSNFGNSVNQEYSRSNSWDARMRLEWQPDTLWNIMFRPQWQYNSKDNLTTGPNFSATNATFTRDPYGFDDISDPLDQSQLQQLINAGVVKNINKKNAINYSDSKNVSGSLQVNRKLGKPGRNVTLRLQAGYSDGITNAFTNNAVDYYDPALVGNSYEANRYAVTPTKNWNYSIRTIYSEPIMKQTYLQFTYQYHYKYSKSDRTTYDLSNQGWNFFGIEPKYRGWDDDLALMGGAPLDNYVDPNLSKFSEYRNYIHTAEVSLRVVRKAMNLNVGVKMMPQSSKLDYRYQNVDTVTRRSVFNMAPTVDFRYKFSDVSQLRMTYRSQSDEPSMTDLLDITDDSDPLNIRRGNPSLKPAFTQNIRIFYNNYWQRHQRSLMAHLFFNTTRNSVSSKVTYDMATGGKITQPENINGNWNMFSMLMFNTAVDSAANFFLNTFTTLRYVNSVGYVSVLNQDSEKSTTRSTTFGERLAFSYRNDWFEVELNGQLDYVHARSELQTNNNLDTWTFSYGGAVMLTAPWGTQLSTSMNMNSRRGYNDAAMNTNELIWNAQLSQSFLRGKALTLSLQFYDLLHRQSAFSRSVTAMQRVDTEYNAITNYAMLHVIYKLNIFGGVSSMKGPGGQGGREGRGGWGGPGGTRGGGWGGGRPRF